MKWSAKRGTEPLGHHTALRHTDAKKNGASLFLRICNNLEKNVYLHIMKELVLGQIEQ
jgi:hypothetical protein